MRKTHLVSAVILVIAYANATVAQAELLTVDQFTGGTGVGGVDSLSGQGGGIGWSTNWTDAGGDGRDFNGSIPDNPNPSVAALQLPEAGHSAQIRSGAYYRDPSPSLGADGSTVWMSWRFRFKHYADAEALAHLLFKRGTSSIWALWQARGINGDTSTDGQFEVFGYGGPNTTNVNIGPRNPLGNNFVVAKMTYGAGDADAIDVWLNPLETTDFTANSATRLTGTDFSFDRVEMYNAVGNVWYFDEFFMGQIVQDVTTLPTAPEPSTIALAAFGLLGLGLFRRRRR